MTSSWIYTVWLCRTSLWMCTGYVTILSRIHCWHRGNHVIASVSVTISRIISGKLIESFTTELQRHKKSYYCYVVELPLGFRTIFHKKYYCNFISMAQSNFFVAIKGVPIGKHSVEVCLRIMSCAGYLSKPVSSAYLQGSVKSYVNHIMIGQAHELNILSNHSPEVNILCL